MELLNEMSDAIEAGISPVARMWLNWVLVIFFASVFFMWRHKGARYAFIAMVLSLPLSLLIYSAEPNIHLIGVTHIILWTPVAFYIVAREMLVREMPAFSLYGIWAVLLVLTIVVSLIFDVRDVFLVLTGQK